MNADYHYDIDSVSNGMCAMFCADVDSRGLPAGDDSERDSGVGDQEWTWTTK